MDNTIKYLKIDNEYLREEIKKLKKEVKSLRCSEVSVEDHQKVCDFLNNQAEEYIKKYQEAREENEKLRHQGLRLMKRLEEYDYQFDWTDEKRKLNDEIEKLKEDIETSEDNVMNITEERDEYFGETEKLKEENKYLNNRYKNAIKIIDATSAYDIDLDCDNEVDDYLEGLL